MGYSSMVDDENVRELLKSEYERLRTILKIIRAGRKEDIYVLKISDRTDLGRLEMNIKDPNIEKILKIRDSIDFIVYGSLANVRHIADIVYQETSEPIGGVKVEADYHPGRIQSMAEIARRIADDRKETFHLYDPGRDSVEAHLKS